MALSGAAVCPLCEGSHGRTVWQGSGRGGVEKVIRCHDCGVAYNAPMPDEAALAAWYSGTYFSNYYGGDRAQPSLRQRPFVQAAQRRLGGQAGRLLDVGCGVGDLCVAAQQEGWEAVGVELAPAAARQAAQRGVCVLTGKAEAVLGSDRAELKAGFHMVVFRDSLVHMPRAREALQAAHALLRPGGWLALRVPNRHAGVFAVARLAGRVMDTSGVLHLPAQVFHMDRVSLSAMLSRQGFQQVEVLGESESVAENQGRYSRSRLADLAWRTLVHRWQRRGEWEALWAWGCKP